MIKAWYLAKLIKQEYQNENKYIIEMNTNDVLNLEMIDLSNEKFEKITTNCFKDFKRLRILNMQKNDLNEIESDAFNGLEELTELNLYDNKLIKLTANMLKGLKQLYFID